MVDSSRLSVGEIRKMANKIHKRKISNNSDNIYLEQKAGFDKHASQIVTLCS